MKEECENYREITKETTNKVMRKEIQFQDNRLLTAKIKSNKNQKKKLNDENCKKQPIIQHVN